MILRHRLSDDAPCQVAYRFTSWFPKPASAVTNDPAEIVRSNIMYVDALRREALLSMEEMPREAVRTCRNRFPPADWR
jgi:hypothetical protein